MFKTPECVRVLKVRDTGRFTTHDFSIIGTTAEKAAPVLVSTILEGFSLFINDHRRDDSEASLIFRRMGEVLLRMNGGHGYSSRWNVVSEDEAIAEATATLHASKWGPRPGGGYFEIPNGPLTG